MPFNVRDPEIDALVRQLTEKTVSVDPEIAAVLGASTVVRAEARRLSAALWAGALAHGRRSEQTLRNVLEAAGLNSSSDFQEQFSVDNDERNRPDVKVNLPGGGAFVIDAKCSLNAFLEAQEAMDAAERDAALARHAQDMRIHMQSLASPSYWKQFPREDPPKFVAMFLPGDHFLAAALQRLPALLAEAAESKVVLVTPTTLLALCKAMTEAREVSDRTEAVKLAGTEALAAREMAREEKLAKMRAVSAEVSSWPRSGLKADKAFFDEMYED